MGSNSVFDKVIRGDDCNDNLEGSAGRDKILGGKGHDVVNGGAGNDTIEGDGISKDTVSNESEDCLGQIAFGMNNDHDTLSGGTGDDEINGGAGDDKINGDEDNDKLSGGSGHDEINGGAGRDELFGGTGNDHLTGGTGNDILNGGGGHDTYYFNDDWGHDIVTLSPGTRTFVFKTTTSPDTFTVERRGYDLLIKQGSISPSDNANNASNPNNVNSVNSIRIQFFFHPALTKTNSFSYKDKSYDFTKVGNKPQLLLAGG